MIAACPCLCFAENCLVFPHPICVATTKGDVESVKRLLNDEPKLIAEGENGYDLVTLAAIHEQKAMIEFLISRGMSVDSNSMYGGRSLHAVVVSGKKDMAQYLLDRGANVNALDRNGRSALHVAASLGQLEIAAFLRSRGATVDAFSAVALNDARTVSDFLKQNPFSVTNRSSMGTVSYGSVEYGGMTLLEFAIIGGSEALVKLLIQQGSDVNAAAPLPIPVYPSPLHEAAQFGRAELVDLLIANGARIDATNRHGVAPIHFAARHGQNEVLEKLIEHGVDVNVADREGMTPLHYAAMFASTNVVECLLRHNADVNARAKHNATPLRAAYGQRRDLMVQFLRQYGGHD